MAEWIFDPYPPLSYDLIVSDPPWRFSLMSGKGIKKSPQAHYSTMTLDELKAMPVSHLARGDAALVLWATNPMLDVAIDVMGAWGFKFKTAGHWSKRTKKGKQAFGTGYILRCAGEPFLIGSVGAPHFESKSIRSVIEGVVREHSRKPDEFYREMEKLMPSARKIDLFARQSRPGWDTWGLEATKFDGEQNAA